MRNERKSPVSAPCKGPEYIWRFGETPKLYMGIGLWALGWWRTGRRKGRPVQILLTMFWFSSVWILLEFIHEWGLASKFGKLKYKPRDTLWTLGRKGSLMRSLQIALNYCPWLRILKFIILIMLIHSFTGNRPVHFVGSTLKVLVNADQSSDFNISFLIDTF